MTTDDTDPNDTPPRSFRFLRRPVEGRMVAGVALAVADYFDLDVTVVRIAFVVLSLLGGLAVPLYLAAWVLVPEEGCDHALIESWLDQVGWHGQA
jgi:phage shock protein PspC (stress-responsive transcriptional regulator)